MQNILATARPVYYNNRSVDKNENVIALDLGITNTKDRLVTLPPLSMRIGKVGSEQNISLDSNVYRAIPLESGQKVTYIFEYSRYDSDRVKFKKSDELEIKISNDNRDIIAIIKVKL